MHRAPLLRRLLARLALLAAGWAAGPASAAEPPTHIRLTLEFRVYGGTAPIVLADQRGYFRDAGIDAKIDGGTGSGEAIRRVAGGAYDFGIADVGTLVEFNARNGAAAPKIVMLLFDTAAHAIVSFKRTGIAAPSDLVGHRLVTGQSDATARIFPSFARIAGLDLAKVTIMPVDVRLREPMLLRGEADASMGYDYTVLFNLLGQNVALDQTAVIDFANYGFAMYGNALIASRAMIAQQPATVRAVARAVARGWVDAVADPAAAIAAVSRLDPLTPAELEQQRLQFVIDHHIVTAATRADGIGAYDPAKLAHTIAVIAEGFELPRRPAQDEIYDGSFLPDRADRMFR
jgi:NitT/TauT family transport system substrate-binding protein